MPSTSSVEDRLPSWDLSDLFASIDDPKIKASLNEANTKADAFAKTYRGNLLTLASTDLLAAFEAFEVILTVIAKIGTYASLVFSADSSDPKHGAFLQKMGTETEAISQKLIFFELELTAASEEIFKRWLTDPVLAPRHYYLQRVHEEKPHRLSEPEEKILSEKSLTGSQAFGRLFEQELSNKRFTIEGMEKPVSESEALHLCRHPDRETRKRAAAGFTGGLKDELRRMTFILNMLVQDKGIDDKYRKFADPEAARHLSNHISRQAVDALNQAVGNAFDVVHDFYRFKREMLGLDELFDYDRYAPLEASEMSFPFEEGKTIVLDAYRRFSPEFADVAQKFFDGKWIDAAKRPGKQGGAFCSFVTPDLHPYVLLNYLGTANDVETMAHELGHGVHNYLSRGHNFLDFHPPLTVCETASIFGEMLVFDALKERVKDDPKALLGLYVDKIQETFASVFRQISMYRFEQDLHAAAREKGELLAEDISAMWRKRQQEMFGDSVTLTADYDVWWSYVYHFFERPFYVYAYAFGELLTMSVYALYKKEGEAILGAYMDFLKAGGSKSPDELVKPFGINLNDPAFWEQGIALIREMVSEAKRLRALVKAQA